LIDRRKKKLLQLKNIEKPASPLSHQVYCNGRIAGPSHQAISHAKTTPSEILGFYESIIFHIKKNAEKVSPLG
jgi:hypothetical protein